MNPVLLAVNLSLETLCAVIALVLMLCLAGSGARHARLDRLFLAMLVCDIVMLACDMAAWLSMGRLSAGAVAVSRVSSALLYMVGYVFIALYAEYFSAYIALREPVGRGLTRWVRAVCAAAVGLVLLSQANGMFYHFDVAQMYVRGPLFWLSQALAMLPLVITALLLCRHRRALSRREVASMLSWGLLPLLAMGVQLFVYGLSLTYVAMSLSLLIVYTNLQMDLAERLRRQERELTDSRIALTLSQIQPHFLFNALTVIHQLCDIDSAQAKDAIADFSDYLRGNLDALTLREPIPFDAELAHVRTYAAMEQRRFGDRLHLELDIGPRAFTLPALSVQPLVENAIRHGITPRATGGSVTLRTHEDAHAFYVTVTDDGIGFDPAAPPPAGRSHVGLANVRARLASLSGGALTLQSAPGQGATAQITLPKPQGAGAGEGTASGGLRGSAP